LFYHLAYITEQYYYKIRNNFTSCIFTSCIFSAPLNSEIEQSVMARRRSRSLFEELPTSSGTISLLFLWRLLWQW